MGHGSGYIEIDDVSRTLAVFGFVRLVRGHVNRERANNQRIAVPIRRISR